jgi:hypothetical protein
MRRHRRGILVTIAVVSMLVGATLIVMLARATQPTLAGDDHHPGEIALR